MFIVRWNVIIVPHYPRGCTLYYFTVGQEVEEIESNTTMFDKEIVRLVGQRFLHFLAQISQRGV